MIEIDGSYGEGGGQILRSSIALSVLTKKPITVNNIRANRPKPGIKPQHHAVLSILKTLSNAEASGLEVGSSKIEFFPKNINGGKFRFDVGTAGSIVLIYQALLFASLKIKKPISIELTGGTDVKWAPSWDYFVNVFMPFLKKIDIDATVVLQKRGYYPKGGGNATIHMQPVETVTPVQLDQLEIQDKISGKIHFNALPDHVAKRMKHTVYKKCFEKSIKVDISQKQSEASSPGIVMTLWVDDKESYIGCVGLGEKGIPAEHIGNQCSMNLIKMMETGATIDTFLFDQILGFLACAKGTSTFFIPELSDHAKTNMWLIQQFFPGKNIFNTCFNKKNTKVIIHGQDIYSFKE